MSSEKTCRAESKTAYSHETDCLIIFSEIVVDDGYAYSNGSLSGRYGRFGGIIDVSLTYPVASDHQLARLLQIGMVLEEVVEARAYKHYETLGDDELDAEIIELLTDAAEESAEHRRRLETLVDELDADSVAYEEIEALVAARYESDTDFDGVLYDQLCNEETAYKFYDDLINAIDNSEIEFSIDRERLLTILREIRDEERDGVEEVTRLMERRE